MMVDMYRRGELLAWAKRLVEGLGMEISGGRGESRKVVESVECGKVRFQWQSQGSPPCQRRFIDSSRGIAFASSHPAGRGSVPKTFESRSSEVVNNSCGNKENYLQSFYLKD